MKRIIIYNTILIISGICFGMLAYFCLSESQSLMLQDFWGQSMQQTVDRIGRDTVIWQIFQKNFQELLRIYFFGICLLGIPLLFIVIFTQGFSLGFLCCFWGGQSVLLALMQCCYLPLYIGAASLAVSFANILLRNQVANPLRQLLKYTLYFLILLGCSFILSCIDGVISNLIMQKMV